MGDLKAAVENITAPHNGSHFLLTNSIIIYDAVYGGLGLTTHLLDDLPLYASQLSKAANQDDQTNFLSARNAVLFETWLNRLNEAPQQDPPPPREDSWWRVLVPGTKASVYSPRAKVIVPATINHHHWENGIKYDLTTHRENLMAAEANLDDLNQPDWVLWQPSTRRHTELFLEHDQY